MFGGCYENRRILVTGHTGFKGAWLSLWLRELGAEVHGFALDPPTQPSLYEAIGPGTFAGERRADVRSLDELTAALSESRPDLVFHLAAQALVRRSYREPIETLATNVAGTANVLEAIRRLELPCHVVVATTDKCYENRESGHAYCESDPLGGHDVYSASKAAAELTVSAWRRSFFEVNPRLGHVASVRAGNVIGGGDFGEDRIVPDCWRALSQGRPIEVRSPHAVRPWQHVLDCLSGYLWLGARLAGERGATALASAFNFGPPPQSRRAVGDLVEAILALWPGEMSVVGNAGAVHEAKLLALDTTKASELLGWQPVWAFDETVRHTVEWYRKAQAASGADLRQFSVTQIERYCEDGRARNAVWGS